MKKNVYIGSELLSLSSDEKPIIPEPKPFIPEPTLEVWTTDLPPPRIVSFTVDRSWVDAGEIVTLTAVFENGSGRIYGIGTVQSGVPVSAQLFYYESPYPHYTFLLGVTGADDQFITATVEVAIKLRPIITSWIASDLEPTEKDVIQLTPVFENGEGALNSQPIVSGIVIPYTVPPESTPLQLTVSNRFYTISATLNLTITPYIGFIDEFENGEQLSVYIDRMMGAPSNSSAFVFIDKIDVNNVNAISDGLHFIDRFERV